MEKPDILNGWREAIRKMDSIEIAPLPPKMLSRDELQAENILLKAEIQRLHGVVDKLLAHCPDAECSTCAEAVCPHGEPFHFHHDGCPACYLAENPS